MNTNMLFLLFIKSVLVCYLLCSLFAMAEVPTSIKNMEIGIMGGPSIVGGAIGLRSSAGAEVAHRYSENARIGIYTRYLRSEAERTECYSRDCFHKPAVNLFTTALKWDYLFDFSPTILHIGAAGGVGLISYSGTGSSYPVLNLGPSGGIDFVLGSLFSVGMEATFLWITGNLYGMSTDLLGVLRIYW